MGVKDSTFSFICSQTLPRTINFDNRLSICGNGDRNAKVPQFIEYGTRV